MAQTFWITPLDAAPPDVAVAKRACEESRFTCTIVPLPALRDLLGGERPTAAILLGGRPSPPLIEAQRWLADARVPTLILLPTLTDDLEAILLDRGAQDVLRLPLSTRRLGARLRLLSRAPVQVHEESDEIRVDGNVTLSPGSRTVCVGNSPVTLTKSEFDLLLTIALRRGSVVDNHDLSRALGHNTLSNRALQTHASRVRSKLRAAGAPDVISSVRGIGYRLRE